MAFGKKTPNGQKKIEKHQATYEKWWLGFKIDSKAVCNGIPCKGIVSKVEYLGDSFQGSVWLTLDNGCEAYVVGEGYRPIKEDINRI